MAKSPEHPQTKARKEPLVAPACSQDNVIPVDFGFKPKPLPKVMHPESKEPKPKSKCGYRTVPGTDFRYWQPECMGGAVYGKRGCTC